MTSTTQIPSSSAPVVREQIRAAFGNWIQYVDGFPFALALAVIMSGPWPAVGNASPVVGACWLAAAAAWAVGGSLTFKWFTRNPNASPRHASIALCILWGFHGAIWGSAVWVFWQDGNAVNQAILNTITLAIIVSYFSSLVTWRPALIVATGTLTFLQWSAFLHFGGTLSHVFMVAFPAFIVVLANYGLNVSRKYDLALRLRFENEAMAAALTQANRAKNDFLASMSHELRTPLNAIIGYTDLMRQRTFGPIMPAVYASYIEDVHASGQHLLQLINDLLDLSKIEAGKREFEFAPVHLSEIAQDVLRFVETQAQRAHVDILTDLKLKPVIKADERAVKQISINLLSNAVKFSDAGSIVVLFCDVNEDGRTLLGVKDTGRGMTPEMQQRAIEPFTQGGDAFTVAGYGTGLGLPIVKALAEAHQGNLHIQSNPGRGSKIWVEFPAERLIRRTTAAAA
ncbi:MAG: hypothetical protein GC190_12115 [Alphaproteobacteria bacterium]|nr:hypothetical protein [Alphaproteobacteria bacterium]